MALSKAPAHPPEDIATDILAQCARNVNQEEDIQMIDAAFKTTLRQESGSMEFHKAGGQRPYRVCVTDGNVYRNVYISEPRQSRRLRR